MLPNSNVHAMDALHVGAARAVGGEQFITSDERKAQAAKRAAVITAFEK